MIGIRNAAGDSLHLTPGQNLVTEQACAWLSDEELPAEFSYPITAPLYEHNRRFVGYGYRPDVARPRRQIAVTVEMDGVLYRRCQFAFRAQGGKLVGHLKIDSAEAYDALRNKSLLEALPDRIRLGTGTVDALPGLPAPTLPVRMEQIARMPPGQFPCTFFPIRNEGFFETDAEAKLAGKTNPAFTRQSYVNAWGPLNGTGVNYGFLTDLNAGANGGPALGYPVVPLFYVSWVLERIMNLAGFRIESDWLATEAVQRLVVVNMTAMSVRASGLAAGLAQLVDGHSVIAGRHLPDMSVSDFLKAVKGRFGLAITFNANSRVCRITRFADAIARPPAVDLTPFQSGPYDLSADAESRGFAVVDFVDAADALFKSETGEILQPAPLIVGTGNQPVSLRMGTTQSIFEVSPAPTAAQRPSWAGRWTIPTVRLPGNTFDSHYDVLDSAPDRVGKRRHDIGLAALTFRGFSADSTGRAYPLGTPDDRDGRQAIVSQQTAALAGKNGIWRGGLRVYYLFRDQTQTLVQPLRLPVALLSSLRLDEPVALTLEDQIRRSYLIGKLQAQAPGRDGMVGVRLEVLTLPTGLDESADVDEPMVWVDLVLGARQAQTLPIPPPQSGTYPVWRQSVTVRCWADAARTRPAVPIALTIRMRQLSKGIAGARPSTDVITSYVLNTTVTVVEPGFVATENLYLGNKAYIFDRTIQLDPGEGYTILI